MDRVGRHVYVSGRVQGVAFRWYAQEKAVELGVRGWIRNLGDGRVEAWVEADGGAVWLSDFSQLGISGGGQNCVVNFLTRFIP